MKVTRRDLMVGQFFIAAYNNLTTCSFKSTAARKGYIKWSKEYMKVVEDFQEFEKKTKADCEAMPALFLEQMEEYGKEEVELPEFNLKDEDINGELTGAALQGLTTLGVLNYE